LAAWHTDWAWGLPLIVLNVVIHVVGLGLINARGAGGHASLDDVRSPPPAGPYRWAGRGEGQEGSQMGWRVGVDIGGTFTEVALIEEETDPVSGLICGSETAAPSLRVRPSRNRGVHS
jgi:hypothetical protein